MTGRRLSLVLLLFAAAPAHAQVARPEALAELNREFQEVWSRLTPAAIAEAKRQARSELAAVDTTSKRTEVEVTSVGALNVDLNAAPALTYVSDRRLDLAVPGQGSWSIEGEATVRVKLKFGFFHPTFNVPIKLQVDRIKVRTSVELDVSDPYRPAAKRIGTPR